MKNTILLLTSAIIIASACKTNQSETKNSKEMNKTEEIELLTSLESYVEQSLSDFDQISDERKKDLEGISEYISKKVAAKDTINLILICTHNSRRSHLSQLWAQVAAYYYSVPNVLTYSGGTEATAFNSRAVKAIKKAGFEVDQTDSTDNPRYKVTLSKEAEPVLAFSKKFADEFNPQDNFAAIMTCSSADEACPFVPGADARFAIPYEDPKAADNTPEEEAKYDERCRQISVEMLYMFSKVKA